MAIFTEEVQPWVQAQPLGQLTWALGVAARICARRWFWRRGCCGCGGSGMGDFYEEDLRCHCFRPSHMCHALVGSFSLVLPGPWPRQRLWLGAQRQPPASSSACPISMREIRPRLSHHDLRTLTSAKRIVYRRSNVEWELLAQEQIPLSAPACHVQGHGQSSQACRCARIGLADQSA